jgi:hypothetical protein
VKVKTRVRSDVDSSRLQSGGLVNIIAFAKMSNFGTGCDVPNCGSYNLVWHQHPQQDVVPVLESLEPCFSRVKIWVGTSAIEQNRGFTRAVPCGVRLIFPLGRTYCNGRETGAGSLPSGQRLK